MKSWGRHALVSSPTDADFGLRDQLGPPPRPQGGESKGYTFLITPSGPTGIGSAVETILRHASMGKKPPAPMIAETRESLPSRVVGDEALRGAQKK